MIDRNYIEYLIYFFPVIVGHIVIPPLSYFIGDKDDFLQTVIYPNLPRAFFDRRLIRSMLLDNNRRDIWETYITHMFVHGSYNHLFMNLVAAVQFGYPVYMEYGPIGLYTVFLCGGVFAALPSVLYLGQQKQVTKGYENVYSSICKRYLPSFFDSTVDGLSGWLGKTTNWLLTPSVSCGSSGAVFAMMGCNLGLLLHSLISTNADLFDLKYGQTKVFRLDGKVRTRHWSEWFAIVSKNIQRAIYKFITNPDSIWKVIQIISMIRYLLVELDFVIDLESLFRPLSVSVGLENLDTSFLWNVTGKQQNKSFAEVMEGGRIGHANHVQGMLFGLAYAGVFTFTLPYFAKKFR